MKLSLPAAPLEVRQSIDSTACHHLVSQHAISIGPNGPTSTNMQTSDEDQSRPRGAVGDPVQQRHREDTRLAQGQALSEILFDAGREEQQAFAVLDGASVRGLVRAIETHGMDSSSLFEGAQDLSMERVAPRLVQLDRASGFTDWMLSRGWGRHWGILLQSQADMGTLLKHLRSMLMVESPTGALVLFRFYDPRVLRTYLPTCTAQEAETFLGPIEAVFLESSDGNEALRFSLGHAGADLVSHPLG